MATVFPASYSPAQRVLHWAMALLIFFNLILSDGIEVWNRTVERGEPVTADILFDANIHAYVGIAILALVVVRLVLRWTQGAPAAPAGEPPLAKLAATVTHVGLYALFFLMPMSGIARYYFDIDTAGELHAEVFKVILWVLIAAHVAGALAQQFYWKTDVLRRMTRG